MAINDDRIMGKNRPGWRRMSNMFETDPYSGKPKILFIGLGSSSHAHAWIDLLNGSQLNVRMFSIPGGGIPPAGWDVRTYVCDHSGLLQEGLNHSIRQYFYREDIKRLEIKLFYRALVLGRKAISFTYKRLGMPGLDFSYADYPLNNIKITSPDVWLAKIIQEWRPDIIHTLGVFDGQGGEFYLNVRKKFGLKNQGIWVLQLRGGSDIALRRYNPETAKQILDAFRECDQIITDNRANMEYIKNLGLANKVASIAPIPGTGGMDVNRLASMRKIKTSQSREIIFPKGYELAWSKCLPIFEAFQLCWDRIVPCKIHILNLTPETRSWFYSLPLHIRESCILHDRIPREEFFSLLANCRILLIPSLVDGVPNSLYEAMALGAFPIVSPLETITPVVKNEENVLFARNLYPTEISAALVRAMSDDNLVDRAAQNNFQLVEKIASRSMIAEKVINYYQELVG